jgi:hypothetical protein
VTNDLELKRALYDRVSESYHNVDDFRMKLLGFLPVATGTAVFLLLNVKAEPVGGRTEPANGTQKLDAADALLAIGLFGLAFTLGLFAYELYGIKKCHYLIAAGARLEREMKVPGQFQSRPRELAGFINEPFASAVIYPASLAAWLYLALALQLGDWAVAPAIAVFVVGLIGTPLAVKQVKINQEREDLVRTVVGESGRSEREAADDAKDQWDTHCHGTTDTSFDTGAGGTQEDGGRQRVATPRPRWFNTTVKRLLEQGDLRRGKDGRLHLNNSGPWTAAPLPGDTPDVPASRTSDTTQQQ